MSTTTLTRHVAQHATAAAPLRAVIYARISADREGRELGVSRRSDDARAYIARRGYALATDAPGSVAGEYRDNDRGASTHSRKPRLAFAAML